MSNFTNEQTSAILFDKGNCLVSAGAGSGKTAVLTERIFWLIVKPLDPKFDAEFKATHNGHSWGPDDKEEPVFVEDAEPRCKASEILVLTFGKGAAIEMKERARQKIRAHKATAEYLASIEESDISNFDSFWLKMVNDNYFELGLPSKVSIVDETFVSVLTRRYIDELIEEKCKLVLEGKEEAFAAILKEKCVKDTNFIVKGVLSVLNLSSLAKDPDEFFANYEQNYLSDEFLEAQFGAFSTYIVSTLRSLVETIKANYDGSEVLYELDKSFIEDFLACPNFDAMHALYLADHSSFPRAPKGESALLSNPGVRDAVKKKAMEVISMLEKTKQEYIDLAKSFHPTVRLFLSMAFEVYTRLQAWMKKRACYDFAGVANLMRKLLDKPEVRERFRKKYKYIMLDEYQDTSNVQEDLIQSIAAENVFAVGDIKQSIYRFRKANPKTFHDKLIAYGKGQGGTLVTLPDNFRSRRQIIESINVLFQEIMTETVGGVDYSNNQALRFANHKLFDLTENCETYGIQTIPYLPLKEKQKVVLEAELIAQDIKNKVESGFLVSDKRNVDENGNAKSRPCQYGDFAVLVSRKRGFGDFVRAFKDAGIPVSVKDKEAIGEDDVIIVFKAILSCLNLFQSGDWDERIVASSCFSLARSFLFRMKDDEIYLLLKNKRYRDFPFFKQLVALSEECRRISLKELFVRIFEEFDFASALATLEDVEMNYKKIVSLLGVAESLENLALGLPDMMAYLEDIDHYDMEFAVDGGNLVGEAVKIMSDHFSKGLQYKICYFPELYALFSNEGKSFAATTEFGICLSSFSDSGEAKGDYLGYLTSKNERAENVSERMRLFYVALTRAEELAILLTPIDVDKEGNPTDKTPLFLSDSKCFLDFFRCTHIDFPVHEVAEPQSKNQAESTENPAESASIEPILIEKLNAKGKLKTRQRASIELSVKLDPGILQYGMHLHRVMELTNFGKKELPKGLSPKEIETFSRILELPLFKDAHLAKEHHEYEYYDQERGELGSMDLILVYDDHIDLVDYKASTLNLEKYAPQFASYEKYLKKAFPGKRIDKYLLSIGKAEIKRVD